MLFRKNKIEGGQAMFLLAETTVANGMSSIVSQLTTGITSAGLFGTVSEIIPFVIVMIGFAFGYKVLKKAVKGASKGKANI